MIYHVWCISRGEVEADARQIEARHPALEAERWARMADWDSNEFQIVGGEHVRLRVEGSRGTEFFEVKSILNYTAKRILLPSDT